MPTAIQDLLEEALEAVVYCAIRARAEGSPSDLAKWEDLEKRCWSVLPTASDLEEPSS